MIMKDLLCLTSEVQIWFEFWVNLHYRELVVVFTISGPFSFPFGVSSC